MYGIFPSSLAFEYKHIRQTAVRKVSVGVTDTDVYALSYLQNMRATVKFV